MSREKLPKFPGSVTPISETWAVMTERGQVKYLNRTLPGAPVFFAHAVDDLQTFRMFTSQFCMCGTVTQSEIVRAFGVSLSSVRRGVKLLREEGPAGFYV